jgi:ABC-2 type transport system permease protein
MFTQYWGCLVDSWTVIQKETRELGIAAVENRSMRLVYLILLALFGVILPWWQGYGWTETPMWVFVILILPIPLVVMAAADSFSGERERHTLETLLASRLPIQSILTGKLFAASMIGWLASLAILLVGFVTVNLTHPEDLPRFYQPTLGAAVLAPSLLIAVFTACIGGYISLRATTVRQSRYAQSAVLLLILFGLTAAGAVALYLTPTHILAALAPLPIIDTLILGGIVLAILDMALYTATAYRYRRMILLTE